MSKMDNLRAMREAKYERARAAQPAAKPGTPAAKPTVKPTTGAKRPSAVPVTPDVEGDGERLCGHRNMSGRTCTREHGHAAKSHRYS